MNREYVKIANVLRFTFIVVFACAIFEIPHSVKGGRIDQILARAGINVAVLIIVPVVYKMWRLPGDESVSGKRWVIGAVLLFAVNTVEDFYRFSYFAKIPSVNRLADFVHHESACLQIVLLAAIAVVIILRQIMFLRRNTGSGRS